MNDLIAIYPGTFDPLTNGHLDIIERASNMFSKLYITILTHPTKRTLFSLETRLDLLRQCTQHINNVQVSSFEGLTVEYCHLMGAKAIVRGLRAQMDFEYEFQIAAANQHLAPDIEMVFLMTRQNLAFVSSSTVKEIASFHGKIDELVPAEVAKVLLEKYQ